MIDLSEVREYLSRAEDERTIANYEPCHSPVEDRLIEVCWNLIQAIEILSTHIEAHPEWREK